MIDLFIGAATHTPAHPEGDRNCAEGLGSPRENEPTPCDPPPKEVP